jgi:hypothetical protein
MQHGNATVLCIGDDCNGARRTWSSNGERCNAERFNQSADGIDKRTWNID